MLVRKAVIPAAGLGTRFLPATKAMPKEMLPIVDKPAIQFVVEEAISSGIEDILIITGRHKRAIEDHFDKSFELEEILRKRGKFEILEEIKRITELADIYFVRQKEPIGLGDAVLKAEKHVDDEPFAVLLGDDIFRSDIPITKQLVNIYGKVKSDVLAIERVGKEKVSKYGIVKITKEDENLFRVLDIVEKPKTTEAPSNFGTVGRYIFNPDIFDFLKEVSPGVDNDCHLYTSPSPRD